MVRFLPPPEFEKKYGPLTFPAWYGLPLYDVWKNETTQFYLAILSTVAILYILRNFLIYVFTSLKPSKIQAYCHAETGSWALVTGASDGIGRAFVDEFLDRGFNVLLHGRNEAKLQNILAELKPKHPRRSIDIVVADASRGDNPEDAVVQKVATLPGKLVVLCNNVGGAVPPPGYARFADASQADTDAHINLNARFPTQLTRALLHAHLLPNKPSLILNLCSVTSVFGVPYLTTYGAAKGFNLAFTKSLRNELSAEGYGNDVEVMGFVIANVLSASNTVNMWPFTITARECARGCLARVGSGKTLAYASWRHALQVGVIGMLPDAYVRSFLGDEMKKRLEEVQKGE